MSDTQTFLPPSRVVLNGRLPRVLTAILLWILTLALKAFGCSAWLSSCWNPFVHGEEKSGTCQPPRKSVYGDESTRTSNHHQIIEVDEDGRSSCLYPITGPPEEFLGGLQDRPQLSYPPLQRERFMPKTVPCRIATNLKKVVTWHKDVFEIDWLEDAAFLQCQELLVMSVQKQTQANCEKYFVRSMQYRIMQHRYLKDPPTWSDQRACSPDILFIPSAAYEVEWHVGSVENSGEWGKKIPEAITQAFKSEKDSTFILELELLCDSFEPFPLELCQGSECGCAGKIRQFLGEQRIFVDDTKDPPWFIPRRLLTEYFTTEVIEHLIEHDHALMNDDRWRADLNNGMEKQRDFVKTVHEFLVGQLATCLFIELDLRCIYHLHLHHLYDDTRVLENVPFADPLGLDKVRIERFLKYRGFMSPHQFEDPWSLKMSVNSKSYLQNIEPHIVVPVIRKTKLLGKSANGTVYCVSIPEGYHRMSENVNENFAMKAIERSQDQVMDGGDEGDILQKLTEDHHPHLLPLLASWTQGEKRYLLLPLAESNLHQFMLGVRPRSDRFFIIWLITQMAGLASRLDHLHHRGPAGLSPILRDSRQLTYFDEGEEQAEFTGMHGDLKPANILVFRRDILKIGDFGHARLKQKINGESYDAHTARGDSDYCSPDFYQHKKVSRPHDIWALGCIFLEMLVWAFFSAGEVERFHDERLHPVPSPENYNNEQYTHDSSFWYRSRKDQRHRLKDVVKKNLEALEMRFRREYVFTNILTMVKSMLRFDPGKRSKPSFVSSLLDKMKAQANLLIEKDIDEKGPDYFTKMLWLTDLQEDLVPKKSLQWFGPPTTLYGDQVSRSSYGYRNGQERGRGLSLRPSSPYPAVPDPGTDLSAAGGQFSASERAPTTSFHEYVPATPTSPAVIRTHYDTEVSGGLTHVDYISPVELSSSIEPIIQAAVTMQAALGTTTEKKI